MTIQKSVINSREISSCGGNC